MIDYFFSDQDVLVVIGGCSNEWDPDLEYNKTKYLDDVDVIDVQGHGLNCKEPPKLPVGIASHISAIVQKQV